ncbi:CD180 antigen isoform X2 [Ictalurus punctatus]|nr:CD180 antigen isoform X2 [Ictalurus punctatus]XP_017315601.1 CD180 antigen isoform X2 [Ictalurus punctatus]
MERVLYICVGIVVYFMLCIETIPWMKKQCIKTADGSDCSGLALQLVPDEIPDSIKTLDFSFNYLPTLYNSTFQRLRSLVSLDLTRCSINFMYEDVFEHQLDLESLILVANPLNFISDRAFAGPLALKHLSLAGSTVRSLTDVPTAHLEFLETLDLRGSDIHNLDGLENVLLQQMKRLFLGMNSIEKIKTADVEKLQGTSGLEISFKGNDLVDVEPNAFQNLDMGSLDFSGCFNKMDISVLLKGLEGVKTNKLYLGIYEDSAKNYITQTALQSFCNISVSDVDFQLQHFRDLSNTGFRCFAHVQKLDFTRAHLSAFPLSLSNLSMLSHLVLDDNSFHSVCDVNAANFPKVTYLSVSRNGKYLHFKENCLEPLSYLEELQLSHSSLMTGDFCCNKQLTGLRELKSLNLSYNFLMNWEPLPFNATPKLKHLDLTQTKYVLNSSSPFSNLEKLQTLNLSFTDFKLLENADILKGLTKLRVLNLKGNTIQGGVLAKTKNFDYIPLLESLVLSSCGIKAISGNVFKDFAYLNNVDLSENQLVKLRLADFYSLNQIQLNFAGNKITVVDVKIVEDLGTRSTIDLSSNPLACNCTTYPFIMWVKENFSKMKHIERTFCNATNEKVLDVDLQCVFSNRALGIVLGLAIAVTIIISLLYFVKKIQARYRSYSVL